MLFSRAFGSRVKEYRKLKDRVETTEALTNVDSIRIQNNARIRRQLKWNKLRLKAKSK
jgi:hypothetical protein